METEKETKRNGYHKYVRDESCLKKKLPSAAWSPFLIITGSDFVFIAVVTTALRDIDLNCWGGNDRRIWTIKLFVFW